MADVQQRLLTAIKQQSPSDVKAALAAGADPNAYADEKSMLCWHEYEAGLLLDYEQPAWLGVLEALLTAGANPNLSTDLRFEEYLLHSLSQHSILTAMRLVLDHGADPNLLCEGDTALNWLDSDYSYEETCNLPAWYKGRVLPEYEAPNDDLEDRETGAIWLVARHQRGWAVCFLGSSRKDPFRKFWRLPLIAWAVCIPAMHVPMQVSWRHWVAR